MKIRRTHIILVLSTIIPQLSTFCHAQGSLTPPGAPAPMMKTLDQLEPRKPVDANSTPGDATNQFIISQPGSYYLAGNLTGVAGKRGIRIAASNVTLDLNGFCLTGVAGATSAVEIGSVKDVTVRHGVIRSWPGVAVQGAFADRCNYERLRIFDCGANGVAALDIKSRSLVTDCVLSGNHMYGIEVGAGECAIRRCSVRRNTNPEDSAYGIVSMLSVALSDTIISGHSNNGLNQAGKAMVSRCISYGNGGDGFAAGAESCFRECVASQNANVGISGQESSIVEECVAWSNGHPNGLGDGLAGDYAGIHVAAGSIVRKCSSNANSGDGITTLGLLDSKFCQISDCLSCANERGGIRAGSGSSITNSLTNGNLDIGIAGAAGSSVRWCHASANTGVQVSGIAVTGTGSRIEGNHVRDNGSYGISSGAAGANTVVSNTSGGNGTGSYSPASGTTFGPLQTPAAGLSPKANF